MNAVIISGFLIALVGVITLNAGHYWHRKWVRWLSWLPIIGGSELLGWGADMAHRNIQAVVLIGVAILASGGTLAFVAFMAEIRHQGWAAVVKRMRGTGQAGQ